MKFLSTENKILLGFGVASVVLLVIGVAAYVNISQSAETALQVMKIGNTIDRLRSIVSNVGEVENAQRGFVITGREYYLRDFETAATNVEAAILVLQSHVGPHEVERRLLDSLAALVRERLEFAREINSLRRTRGLAAAREAIMTDRGLKLSGLIRELVSDLEQGESETLRDFTLLERQSNDRTLPIIVFSSAIAVMFLCLAIVIIRRDIIQRRKLENALQEHAEELQRSNADLERFAYVASHDLKEPLRVVSSFSQLLEAKYRDTMDDEGKEFVRYAIDGSKRMQVLIDDLLAYSRVGTRGNPFADINGDELLREVLTNIRIIVEEHKAVVTSDPLPVLHGDVVQLGQVLQNLIVNGIKFQKSGPARIHVSAQRTEQEIIVSVRDNGIGIDPRYFGKLFTIFQRLHTKDEYPGTGIGLAVCKRIVERHKGRIWVESAPGNGSTFFFSLPIGEESKP